MARLTTIYCCPVESKGPEHLQLAYRFVASMLAFPPGKDHDLVVISNGGPPSSEMEVLFSSIPGFTRFFEHDDTGWDIGGFQAAGRTVGTEVVLMFGGNAYFKRAGWMVRMMEAYDKHGPHLYGAFGCQVHTPHIRTTGFWLPTELFNRYPRQVKTYEERYDFEHRNGSLTQWVQTVGRKALMVTWGGVYSSDHWGNIRGAYMGGGDHSECLCADRISDLISPPR
jgi:hypothetical protein